MPAGMREFSGDHPIAPNVAVQILPIGPVLHAAANARPMPALYIGEPIGGVPMVVELPANPDDRTGLRRDCRGVAIALAILGKLEQTPLLHEERMLLDVRHADVSAFPGGSHHEFERVALVAIARSMASPAAFRNRAFLSVCDSKIPSLDAL
jgi:hypothetical protein